VLLLNAVYLFGVAPYFEVMDGVLDYLNVVVLILLSMLQACYSGWVPNARLRYYNGTVFDCLLGLSFVLNFGFIVAIAVRPVTLRIKRAHWRYKNKAAALKKTQNS
jgi:hypothetical protein